MRPFKHAAPTNGNEQDFRYQNVLDISLTRFVTRTREIPVVVTSELGRITIYAWNDETRQWGSTERPHAPLTRTAATLQEPAAWNWSRHVSVASTADTLFVVYKRQQPPGQGGDTRLVIDRFGERNGGVQLIDSNELPQTAQEVFGFSLWAGVDEKRQRLLILVQRGERFRVPLGEFTRSLALITLPLDNPGDLSARTTTRVGDGGYDLAARLGGRTLTAVFRENAAAIRFPPPLQRLEITSGPESDAFYLPLTLARVDLDTMTVTDETLPGGQHPQIQSLDPLIITSDRERSTTAEFDILFPLPPRQPRVLWKPTVTDKVAFIRQADGDARGVILSTPARALPRAFRPFRLVTHIIAPDENAIGYASPLDRFPVHLLQIEAREKGLALDILHHRAFMGLLRTRLTTSIEGGTLAVTDSVFEVWDIGHEQIGPPGQRVPDAEAENRQFRPIGPTQSHQSELATAEPVRIDNTIGGHLVADVDRQPAGFFAYTDMGDGGLRVVHSERVGPLPEPPPVADAKHLLPENVTGPRMPGESWVQLDAEDWVDTEQPGYAITVFTMTKSLGGAPEVPIDLLREAVLNVNTGRQAAGEPQLDMISGLSETDLFAVDEFRAGVGGDLTIDRTAPDGSAMQITALPGGFIERQEYELTVLVNGEVAETATWTFVPLPAPGLLPEAPLRPGDAPLLLLPLAMVAVTNPVVVRFPTAGRWRVSVFHGVGAQPAAGVFLDVTVADSIERLVWAAHEALSEGATYTIGSVRIQALQNVVTYTVPAEGERIVAFEMLLARATQMRFRGNDDEQGLIDCRAHMTIDSTDVALDGPLALAFVVKDFHVDLLYERAFTPGVLMVDRRAFDPATGADLEGNPLDTIGRSDPLAHAAISSKPVGDRRVTAIVAVRVELTPGGVVIPAILAALAIVGATAAAVTVVMLLDLLVVAVALGAAGAALAVAVSIALAVFLAVIVPRLISDHVSEHARQQLESETTAEALDRQGLLRYGGEGLSEGIARQVITRAIEEDHTLAPPAAVDDEERIGNDRSRGQTFQMVFVSPGACRVLVRDDE